MCIFRFWTRIARLTHPVLEFSSGAFDSPWSALGSPLDRTHSHLGSRDCLPQKAAIPRHRGGECQPKGALETVTRHDLVCENGGRIAGKGRKSCVGLENEDVGLRLITVRCLGTEGEMLRRIWGLGRGRARLERRTSVLRWELSHREDLQRQ